MTVIEYPNGDTYDGEWSNDKRNGQGVLKQKRGGKYEGDWVDDKRQGKGAQQWPKGHRYTGDWRDDKRHGQGTFVYPDGGKYVGAWDNDHRHGEGENTWSDGRHYKGSWKKNVQHGFGVLKYPDGGKYEGEWVNGMRHGHGVNTWANGDKYDGEWRHNQKHGKGVFNHADGTVEEGEWCEDVKDGKPSGKANMKVAKNGMKFNLCWINGQPCIMMLMPKPSSDVCPFLALGRELVATLDWDKNFFDRNFDHCYCNRCYKDDYKDTVQAGDDIYVIPRGWVRLGLQIDPVLAKTQDIWNKWIVTFHGTTLVAIKSILTHRTFCWPGDTLVDGTKLKIRPGHIPGQNHVYTSPTIAYSSSLAYAPVYKFRSKENDQTYEVQLVLQCRQKPGTYQVGKETIGATSEICPHIPNSRIEYYTDRRGSIVTYGLLVRFRPKGE